MTELKPAAPVFRTWWKEWSDAQKLAFNAAIEAGASFEAAVAAASSVSDEVPIYLGADGLIHEGENPNPLPLADEKPRKTRTRKPKEA